MSFIKGRKALGFRLLGAWLIATGVAQLIQLNFLLMDKLLAGLAIAAGALIVLDR
jgi:hypothetical protein